MKKIAVGLIAVFGLTLLQPAHAEDKRSIVIIDTAVDTTLPELQGKIIHEVCLMEENKCPNNKSFMEGPGSATLPAEQVYSGGFEHGTIMSQIATKINPDMNIVFIRIFPMDSRGKVAYNAANANSTVKQALDWVIQNRTKFNIVSVSASVGHRPKRKSGAYCYKDRNDKNLIASIASLKSVGVASIFASGNNYDKSRIDYPSCLADSVAVSSVYAEGNLAPDANDSPEVDFYALGRYDLPTGSVSGTSAATVALAAYWTKSYNGDYQGTYDYLKSIENNKTEEGFKPSVDVLK